MYYFTQFSLVQLQAGTCRYNIIYCVVLISYYYVITTSARDTPPSNQIRTSDSECHIGKEKKVTRVPSIHAAYHTPLSEAHNHLFPSYPASAALASSEIESPITSLAAETVQLHHARSSLVRGRERPDLRTLVESVSFGYPAWRFQTKN